MSNFPESPRVAIFGRAITPAAMQMAEGVGAQVTATDRYLRGEELISFLREQRPHAIVLRLGAVDETAMAAAPDLRIIAKHGVGVDTVDLDAATQRNVLVTIATGANAISVAEQALALMLAVARGIAHLDARIRQGHWDKAHYLGSELNGKLLGIVGIGAIGRRLAETCRALGMGVLAFDPVAPEEAFGDLDRAPTLDRVIAESDVLSLHCPLTPATRNMIGPPQFAAMKSAAILINTARGGLVDLDALIQALGDRQIAGAGLDTFPVEPPTLSDDLKALPNLVMSPHTGASTIEAGERVGVLAMSQVLDYLGGKPIDGRYIVNGAPHQLTIDG